MTDPREELTSFDDVLIRFGLTEADLVDVDEDEPLVTDSDDNGSEYAPAAPVEYEVSTGPEPPWPALVQPLEEAQSLSERPRKARGRSGQGRASKAPELDYGRYNGVGGAAWQRPCDWCHSIHGPTKAQQATRDRHFRYLRTQANGGVAPVEKHTYTTYVNWGCSCDSCCEANNEMSQRRREQTRARRDGSA